MRRIPLDDISGCSSNPQAHKHLHASSSSLSFFYTLARFVLDVSKRINNEWAALTGHIFHLAEMALMQSVCITPPVAEELLEGGGWGEGRTFKQRSECQNQVHRRFKWPSFSRNSWTIFPLFYLENPACKRTFCCWPQSLMFEIFIWSASLVYIVLTICTSSHHIYTYTNSIIINEYK